MLQGGVALGIGGGGGSKSELCSGRVWGCSHRTLPPSVAPVAAASFSEWRCRECGEIHKIVVLVWWKQSGARRGGVPAA